MNKARVDSDKTKSLAPANDWREEVIDRQAFFDEVLVHEILHEG